MYYEYCVAPTVRRKKIVNFPKRNQYLFSTVAWEEQVGGGGQGRWRGRQNKTFVYIGTSQVSR